MSQTSNNVFCAPIIAECKTMVVYLRRYAGIMIYPKISVAVNLLVSSVNCIMSSQHQHSNQERRHQKQTVDTQSQTTERAPILIVPEDAIQNYNVGTKVGCVPYTLKVLVVGKSYALLTMLDIIGSTHDQENALAERFISQK